MEKIAIIAALALAAGIAGVIAVKARRGRAEGLSQA